MNAAWIGIIIGLVMGLTGAGGALVAIPLFMNHLEMTLKEATSFSLVAVALTSLFNLFSQRKDIDFRISLLIIPFSVLSSIAFIPVKAIISEWVIFVLISLVSLLGLFSVWLPSKEDKVLDENKNRFPISAALIGVVLGMLTTLTGLGGGVLILPVLVVFFRFSQKRAVATSFLLILVTSILVFAFQCQSGYIPPNVDVILVLTCGIALSAIFLSFVLSHVPTYFTNYLRRVTFSIIVIFSLTKIIGALI